MPRRKSKQQNMNKRKQSKKQSRKTGKKKVVNEKNKMNNNGKVMTVTCLRCKVQVKLNEYTKKKTKNGAILIQGICPKGCLTKDNKPVKVAGFAKSSDV